MKKTIKRVFSLALTLMMIVMCSNAATIVNAANPEVIGEYTDDFEFEWDYELAFANDTNSYNYSILYEFTDEDVDTFSNLLLQPEKISGVHIRKYDLNGDGNLTLSDFIGLYKEVECPPEGFVWDGSEYAYTLVNKSQITKNDITVVAKILANIIKPEGGSYAAHYDYNFSGDIDLYDLILMNQYYSQNPCNFLLDNAGNEIQPEELQKLLESADAFGLENFIITWTGVIIPYMITDVDGQYYYERDAYPSHPMQVIPRSDTSLDGYEEYLREDDQGQDWSLWRWEQEGDNFDDLLWITLSDNDLNGCYTCQSGFVIIPLDENGNKVGSLFSDN